MVVADALSRGPLNEEQLDSITSDVEEYVGEFCTAWLASDEKLNQI